MKILNNKAGVTVLEGVISLGLLAVVTAGAFGVLVSASRKSSQPEIREEMTLAIERAKNLLQMYAGGTEHVANEYKKGLCGVDDDPLKVGEETPHTIACMLPPICDESNSSFEYTVTSENIGYESHHLIQEDLESSLRKDGIITGGNVKVKFTIQCNGYEL